MNHEHKLHVVGPRDGDHLDGLAADGNIVVVNTTSRSTNFGRAFSPFLCQGPIELGGITAHNVENLWQFTKVYPEHAKDQEGKKALFSLWFGARLSYVEARKAIYIPAYWQKLGRYCTREVHSICDMLTCADVVLWDFDGRVTDESMNEIVNNSDKKMGHAFIIKKFVFEIMGRSF